MPRSSASPRYPADPAGLYGGAVADAMPKRIAFGAIYILDAAVCFLVPIWFGTGLGAIVLLIFAVNVLRPGVRPDGAIDYSAGCV